MKNLVITLALAFAVGAVWIGHESNALHRHDMARSRGNNPFNVKTQVPCHHIGSNYVACPPPGSGGPCRRCSSPNGLVYLRGMGPNLPGVGWDESVPETFPFCGVRIIGWCDPGDGKCKGEYTTTYPCSAGTTFFNQY